MRTINLWLDDIRDPAKYGHFGWTWVKTAEEAIALLSDPNVHVEKCSLDHDLSELATVGQQPAGEPTGYTVILWMEEHNKWPDYLQIHTLNPAGRDRMVDACRANGVTPHLYNTLSYLNQSHFYRRDC